MTKAIAEAPEDTGAAQVQVEAAAPAAEIEPAEAPSQLAQKLAAGEFVVAVEMDPPRGLSTHKLMAGASLLADAGADVIDVADSPRARMRMSPWAVCDLIQSRFGVETTLHFPTRGRNLLRVQGDLLAAHAINIRNVFVIMGDPTAIGDYPDASDSYDLVPTGLIRLIKEGFNAGMDHAGGEIGQPTTFFVGAALNLSPKDPDREIRVLRKKLDSGADFFMSQPVFEVEKALVFLKRYEDQFGPLDRPILAGILPLVTDRHARFLHNEVPGITIPQPIQDRMAKAGEDMAGEGVKIALALVDEVKQYFQGIYLVPSFNRFDMVAGVVEQAKR
jgi:homocysteine S-methyltransferase